MWNWNLEFLQKEVLSGDQCENIGMIGTIAGMCMVLLCFESVDVENISTVQDLIHSLGPGLATAFYTTLLGLVGSSLLKQQYFNLSQAIDNEIVD
jgi:flagellar motor component MotA